MTGHLLAVEIGPVQEFITSARRTRDHWFGSYLVAEIAKAAAKGIADAMPPDGWKNLIFPAPEGPAELEPESRLAVADVLLAEIPPGASPEEVARAAERAVDRRWRSYANTALEQAGPFVRMDVWESQVAEVMECYTAWVPRTNSYPADRRRVMKVLAGRTTCRNFPPAEKEWWGVPKSSLDGMRESVLREPSDPQEKEKRARRLRLNRGEQLDVVALTKRLGGGRMQYPSVSRLVADPWLRGVARTPAAAGDYRRLKDLCRNLVREDILTGINANVYRQYADFPFEAAALFPERYPELAEEAGVPLEHLRGLGHIVGQLTKNREYRLGEPDRYYAILTADGDRLTKALDQIETPVEHRRFSHQLDQFAERARQLITSPDPGAQGALVYAGGDDVLAFVPVDKVLPCARRLREEFVTLLREWSKPDRPLSLSVGIGVGHFLESLEDLLQSAQEGERLAKQGTGPGDERNGLAIRMQARGGAPLVLRRQWGEGENSLDRRLHRWADLLRTEQLPDKAAYDLRRLSFDYQGWQDSRTRAAAIQADARRLLSRKRGGGLRLLGDLLADVRNAMDLEDLAVEVIMARRLATALSQAEGRP